MGVHVSPILNPSPYLPRHPIPQGCPSALALRCTLTLENGCASVEKHMLSRGHPSKLADLSFPSSLSNFTVCELWAVDNHANYVLAVTSLLPTEKPVLRHLIHLHSPCSV